MNYGHMCPAAGGFRIPAENRKRLSSIYNPNYAEKYGYIGIKGLCTFYAWKEKKRKIKVKLAKKQRNIMN